MNKNQESQRISEHEQAEEYRKRYPDAGLPKRGDKYTNLVGRTMDAKSNHNPYVPSNLQWHLKEDSKDQIGNIRLIGAMARDALSPIVQKLQKLKARNQNTPAQS